MNEIGRWQEAMAALPDKQFFNTMRLYMGEIKTPYNKQRLIEQLASFIKNEENTNAILTLLDEFDVKILTAISLMPKSTQAVIADFFSGSYSFSEIFSEVLNLKERLIIYSEIEPYTQKEYLFINPLLEDKIKPYLNTKLVLPDTQVSFYSMEDQFQLSPNFLAAFISYIKIKGISCKSDGIIKKNDQKRLSEMFPSKEDCVQLLMNAFFNLSLVREGEKSILIDKTRLQSFSELPELYQYALLTAASVSRFSKEGLRKQAQLLLDCLCSIPETGYSRQTILRLSFLMGTYSEESPLSMRKSRFSQILEAARSSAVEDPQQNANLLDRMIDSAIEFGLLQKIGKSSEGEEVFKKIELNPLTSENHLLNIDSTFTVTLMPGLSLSKLLPLTSFLLVKKCGVVTEFEITKQSAAFSFDNGYTPQSIASELEQYTDYELPNNLKINISEWYNSYSSATLYHGYVLKVTDTNINFVENNPNIKKYIKEKLNEGVYLLNIPLGEDISQFIGESGLDFLGTIKEPGYENEFAALPLLREGRKISLMEEKNVTYGQTSAVKAAQLLNLLKKGLESDKFNAHQKESLEHRITNRLILSEKQMNVTAIRSEILETDGTDFSGKVHLIEAAIKEEDLMELQMPNANGDGGYFTLVGKPLQVSKQPGEAVVRFQLEQNQEIETILVSRITHLRRLRF